MSVDVVMRAIGTLTCMYSVGLFITVLSMTVLTTVSSPGIGGCSEFGCHSTAHAIPDPAIDGPAPKFLRTAAILLTAEPI